MLYHPLLYLMIMFSVGFPVRRALVRSFHNARRATWLDRSTRLFSSIEDSSNSTPGLSPRLIQHMKDSLSFQVALRMKETENTVIEKASATIIDSLTKNATYGANNKVFFQTGQSLIRSIRFLKEEDMQRLLNNSIDYSHISEQYEAYKAKGTAVFEAITGHHQRIATQKDAWSDAVVADKERLQEYAEAASEMGSKAWVKEANRWMASFTLSFFCHGTAMRHFMRVNNLKKYENSDIYNALQRDLTEPKRPPQVNTSSALSSTTIKSDIASHRKLQVLDVGSCYNPLQGFPEADRMDITAIDLHPATSDVLQCDFLALEIGPPDSEILFHDAATKRSIKRLPARSFDMVCMSLVLSYLPTPEMRAQMVYKARLLLREQNIRPPASSIPLSDVNNQTADQTTSALDASSRHYAGLLLIVEKSSIFNARGDDGPLGPPSSSMGQRRPDTEGRMQVSLLDQDVAPTALSSGMGLLGEWKQHIMSMGFSLVKYANIASSANPNTKEAATVGVNALVASNRRRAHTFAFCTAPLPPHLVPRETISDATSESLNHEQEQQAISVAGGGCVRRYEVASSEILSKQLPRLWIRQDFASLTASSSSSTSSISNQLDVRNQRLQSDASNLLEALSTSSSSATSSASTQSQQQSLTPQQLDDQTPRIVGIIGGGLAGSALALALHRHLLDFDARYGTKHSSCISSSFHNNNVDVSHVDTNTQSRNSSDTSGFHTNIGNSNCHAVAPLGTPTTTVPSSSSDPQSRTILPPAPPTFLLFERDAAFSSRRQGYAFTLQQAHAAFRSLGLSGELWTEGVASTMHYAFDSSGGLLGAYGVNTGRPKQKHNNNNNNVNDMNLAKQLKKEKKMRQRQQQAQQQAQRQGSQQEPQPMQQSTTLEDVISSDPQPSLHTPKASRHNLHLPRQTLRHMLLDKLPPQNVLWRKQLAKVEPVPSSGHDDSKLRLTFTDGTCYLVDVLVGADGISSDVRPYRCVDQSTTSKSSSSHTSAESLASNPPTMTSATDQSAASSVQKTSTHSLRYLGLMVILGIAPTPSRLSWQQAQEIARTTGSSMPSVSEDNTRTEAPNQTKSSIQSAESSADAESKGSFGNALLPFCQRQWLDGHTRVFSMPFNATHTMWQMSFPLKEEEAMALSTAHRHRQRQSQHPDEHHSALKAAAMQQIAQWDPLLVYLIRDTPAAEISGHPVYDRDPNHLLSALENGSDDGDMGSEYLQHLDTDPSAAAAASSASDACSLGTASSLIAQHTTLIGDAAHPMSPFKGQGANQALLDAMALYRALRASTLYRGRHPRITPAIDTNVADSISGIGAEGATTNAGSRHTAVYRQDADQDRTKPLFQRQLQPQRPLSVSQALRLFEEDMIQRAAEKVRSSHTAALFLHSPAALSKANITRAKAAELGMTATVSSGGPQEEDDEV